MPLITFKDAAFSYSQQPVITGLNFSVNKNDYICVIGDNGAGKTTIIKGILGLKEPSYGSIILSDGITRSDIGYMPQSAPNMGQLIASAYEMVLLGRLNSLGMRPFFTKSDRAIAKKAMEQTGSIDIARKCYATLSGGQRQRVLLARALCAAKTLLVLDEPAAGLDADASARMYELLDNIHKRTDMALVMVTHDINNALSHASHVLHVRQRQLFFGETGKYKAAINSLAKVHV